MNLAQADCGRKLSSSRRKSHVRPAIAKIYNMEQVGDLVPQSAPYRDSIRDFLAEVSITLQRLYYIGNVPWLPDDDEKTNSMTTIFMLGLAGSGGGLDRS